MALAFTIAQRFHGKGVVSWEDLVQEAMVALVVAVDYFNPDLGWRFSTYAGRAMTNALSNKIDEGCRTIRISYGVLALRRKLDKIDPEHKLSKTEVMAQLPCSEFHYRQIYQIPQTVLEGEEGFEADAAACVPDPLMELVCAETLERLRKRLSPLLNRTVQRHFVDGETCAAIARREKVTREAVRRRCLAAKTELDLMMDGI
tara:strand:- start:121 stop:726 length:606 start_codon:yes stop_codon:yes gene_type:complete